MDGPIIFIGGVKGVGKTSVINQIIKLAPAFIPYDPAELFDRYYLESKIIKPEFIEQMVATSILGLSKNIVLINWHYGIWKGKKYIPHVNWNLLHAAAEKICKRRKIIFILLESSEEAVYKRRKKDNERGIKIRNLERNKISFEIEQEREYFSDHIKIFTKGEIAGLVINNDNIRKTAQKIIQIVKIY